MYLESYISDLRRLQEHRLNPEQKLFWDAENEIQSLVKFSQFLSSLQTEETGYILEHYGEDETEESGLRDMMIDERKTDRENIDQGLYSELETSFEPDPALNAIDEWYREQAGEKPAPQP